MNVENLDFKETLFTQHGITMEVILSRKSAIPENVKGNHFILRALKLDHEGGGPKEFTFDEVETIYSEVVGMAISAFYAFLSNHSKRNGFEGRFRIVINGPKMARRSNFHAHGLEALCTDEELQAIGLKVVPVVGHTSFISQE